jgi:ABC-type polysaccharide/polyol phosphate transport system ATPase subunit
VSIVSFRHVSKSYPVYQSPKDRLKELATFNRRTFHEDFWALRDVTFNVERGETFCIVGENGSGKSTLLQIIAGILAPSAGDAQVTGRVAALLELGSGFNPEFTDARMYISTHPFSGLLVRRSTAATTPLRHSLRSDPSLTNL